MALSDEEMKERYGDVPNVEMECGECMLQYETAMEDACPHAGVPLSDGTLEGGVITCRAHGWPFDVRTGFAPDDDDGFPIPCFAVEVRDGEVFVDLDDRVNRRRRSPPAR